MATKSVTTKQRHANIPGSTHDLFLRDGDCLTVSLDRNSNHCPPSPQTLTNLHETLLGLGKAVWIVGNLLEDGLSENLPGQDQWTLGMALNGIADAIKLHATLAEAVGTELHRDSSLTEASA